MKKSKYYFWTKYFDWKQTLLGSNISTSADLEIVLWRNIAPWRNIFHGRKWSDCLSKVKFTEIPFFRSINITWTGYGGKKSKTNKAENIALHQKTTALKLINTKCNSIDPHCPWSGIISNTSAWSHIDTEVEYHQMLEHWVRLALKLNIKCGDTKPH